MPFFPKRVEAPDFPVDGLWLNVREPLSLERLRGRVILLDFWTYCCINCLHVLPDLHALETRFGDDLAVIGIHSPKFEEERKPEQVALALKRYDIRHPVFHDPSMRLWQEYGIRAWPTLVLLDRRGRVAFAVSGEGQREALARAIRELLAEPKDGIQPEADDAFAKPWEIEARELWFPTKMAWDGKRLFVADTGHHRIVALDGEGRRVGSWGGSDPGFADGEGGAVRFREPRGLAWLGDRLWVADTANHALRTLDPETGLVHTVFGDGQQTHRLARPGTHPPLHPGSAHPASRAAPLRLNSPWDLVAVDGALYIAMAGSHQIWVVEPDPHEIRPWAGTGQEALTDGPLAEATFSQPSGLCLGADGAIYVADSESSSIRRIDRGEGEVTTLIGRGLFDFGDRDGGLRLARLQHPLAVTARGDAIWVADSYNSKIKILDPEEGKITTLELDLELNEPEGILATPIGLFVADTNQHRILRIDPDQATAHPFHG